MNFVSLEFTALLLLTFILFYVAPVRYRKGILLLASFAFIGAGSVSFLITAIFISAVTFYCGKLINRQKSDKSRLRALTASLILLIGIWTGYRYVGHGILFPLGISFYTFQALSYLIELYWQEIDEERKPLDFLLYMTFFAKFLSGPIERPNAFLPQLKEAKPFDYDTVNFGLKLIFIGLIKKLVIADNLSTNIDNTFLNLHTASGLQLSMATLLYPIELYADFSGYTDMAIGVAALFGIRLSPNFNRPFIAQTTADLWRRWHMSFSFWVKDYVYLPLASSLRRWKEKGIFASLLLTFVALGIWHGAGWTFVVYGLIQGLIICIEMKTTAFRQTLTRILGKSLSSSLFVLRTYLLFALSLLFFKLPTLSDAFYVVSHLSFTPNLSWKEMNLGISDHICIVAGSALLLIWIFEYFSSKKDLFVLLSRQSAWLRWSIYYLLLFALLTTGGFGNDNFIYLQF